MTMGAPTTFFGMIVLTISLIGYLFGFNVTDDSDRLDVRDTITQDCYAIAKAAQGYYGEVTLHGSGGHQYPDLRLTQCGVQRTETGYRGETECATYVVEGNAERFTVTGTYKADIRKTVTVSCLLSRHDGKRYSLVSVNW